MAKVVVSLDDLQTMYCNSLVIYKNRPVLVERVYDKKEFGIFDLTTQRSVILKGVDHEDFKAPGRCLGFVNIMGYVVYMMRNPVRRYKVGLSKESVTNQAPKRYENILRQRDMDSFHSLKSPEICDTVFGRYPSIEDAWNRVKAGVENIVAFDRQFAIDCRGVVFYKTKEVGSIKGTPKSNTDIKWKEGFSYLNILLDNNYEKDLPVAQ